MSVKASLPWRRRTATSSCTTPGPKFSERLDAGRAALVPFLRERGIAHIDALVVSHGDNDHLGGLRSLLAEVSVGRILTSVPQEIPLAACRTRIER